MNGNGKTVCMISCMHDLFDDRIYWKECLSLKKSGYTVFHIGFGKKDRAYVSKEGVNIIEVFRERYFVNPYLDKLFRIVTIKKNPYRKIFIAAKDTKADIYHTHDLQIGRLNKNIKSLSHKPKLIYDVHEYYPDVVLSYFR
ncbi:MAG: hypothetical protein JXB34_08930, partial [Bacteroidales bacterium]|nr:hypothetical protein [Bacteroidales bacterium]